MTVGRNQNERDGQVADELDWLAELGDDGSDAADIAAELLLLGLEPITPTASARERLVAATGMGRLHRFAAALAEMLDVTRERAKELLDRAMDPSGWETGVLPGLATLWVAGGPAAANCIRGFIRLEAGLEFPPHRHMGDENVLVLDGTMIDSSGEVYRPGDLVPRPAGSEHAYRALGGGPDLLTFAVVREGLSIGDMVVRHPD